MNNDNKECDAIYLLGILANILQVFNYQENVVQSSNDDLMKALNVQTRILLDRIEGKLNTVLENQAKILTNFEQKGG